MNIIGYRYNGYFYCCLGCVPFDAHPANVTTLYSFPGDYGDTYYCDACGKDVTDGCE